MQNKINYKKNIIIFYKTIFMELFYFILLSVYVGIAIALIINGIISLSKNDNTSNKKKS